MFDHVAHFEIWTTGFLDSEEQRSARVNEDIGAMTLAIWMAQQLEAQGYDSSEPWVEDHGSDFWTSKDGKTYLIVCNTPDDPESMKDGARWGSVLIDQHRSLLDWLSRRNRGSKDDPIAAIVARLFQSHPDIAKIERLA